MQQDAERNNQGVICLFENATLVRIITPTSFTLSLEHNLCDLCCHDATTFVLI